MVRKTNFLSISVLVYEIITFLIKKSGSLWISPKMLQNMRKVWYSTIWLTLWRKKFLLIFIPFYRFDQKKLFKQIQIFLWICPFSDMVRKTNFLSIPVFVSEITFLTKKSIFLWISLKMLQNNRKHSLAVCGSLWWEKKFLLIFIPFYRFDQKQLVKQIQIFLWICPFSNMVRKTNFVSISVLALWDNHIFD